MTGVWKRRHLILAVAWVLLAVPALIWWKDSVLFVILLSLYANMEASLAAHNAQQSKEAQES